VITTSEPQKAIQILREQPVDLVITDLRMPEMDGLELIGRIKQLDAQIPFIIITAYGTMESAMEACARGSGLYYQTLPPGTDPPDC
jgi:YesN/AraC family two-component response regulator